jgi:hypothetical protein
LRVNVSPDEVLRYSPKMVDVIDKRSGAVETRSFQELSRELSGDYPALRSIVSYSPAGPRHAGGHRVRA